MPDPNNPNDNQNQNPVQDIPAVPPTPPTDTPTPQVFPEDISIPPIPSGLTQTISDAPPQEEGTPPNLPPIISSGKPKKKFGGKMIATILGLLVLVGGLGAGVVLVKQQQDIREKAACAPKCVGNIPYTCDSNGIPVEGVACTGGQTCSNGVCSSTEPPPPPPACIPDGQCMTSSTACCDTSHTDTSCGYSIPIRCGSAPPPGSTPTPSPPPGNGCSWDCGGDAVCLASCGNAPPANITCGPGLVPCCTWVCPPAPPTASCSDVKAYTESWVLIPKANLSSLRTGDKINFCVAGTTTSGSFDKARFKVNGVFLPETTTKRPGTNNYCSLYTIPTGTTTFNILGQIHHVTLGWK